MQAFVIESYGAALWDDIARRCDVPGGGFEILLSYPPDLLDRVEDEVARRIDRTRAEMLEDLGVHIVARPHGDAVRRLLRFSGARFGDFIENLPDLPERLRLAVPGLDLPPLDLAAVAPPGAGWIVTPGDPRIVPLLVGVLRAMADEHGTLALVEATRDRRGIDVSLLCAEHGAARDFALGGGLRGAAR